MNFTLYNKALTSFLDWLFPRYCPECHLKVNHPQGDCSGCDSNLPIPVNPCLVCAVEVPLNTQVCGTCLASPPYFDRCLSAFRYEGQVRELVLDLKTKGRGHALKKLSDALVSQVSQTLKLADAPEAIIPIPMHKTSLKERGFNQSTLLAKALSQQLDIPIDRGLIKKIKRTPKQSGLSLKARRSNLRGAFTLSKSNTYKSIALVDDVVTSTATISEICKILKKNGVDYVEVWSIARAT